MIEELFDKSDRKLDELTENLRATDQRVASFEQDARQPRLAMEADVPANIKTRERTEFVAKPVQAMHGDNFSANRVDPDPMPNLFLSIAGMTPRSIMVLRRQSRVSHPCRCAQQQPPMAYSPPEKPLQRRGSPSTNQFFGST